MFFKKWHYLQDSMVLIRWLWGVHFSDNQWYGPSRLCTMY